MTILCPVFILILILTWMWPADASLVRLTFLQGIGKVNVRRNPEYFLFVIFLNKVALC